MIFILGAADWRRCKGYGTVRVLVCGAGVIGITTAWYLAELGHDVSVIDRRDGPAEETSLANGGQISPSNVDPWPSPENLKQMIGWLGRKDAPLLYRLRLEPALWEWTLRFLFNCTAGRSAINTERMLRVALFSAEKLRDLRESLNLEYGQRTNGIVHIFRSRQAFDLALDRAARVSALGWRRDPKTPEECVAIEPALAGAGDTLVGGFHSPDDETGDVHRFTVDLARHCEMAGVRFFYDSSISEVISRDKRVTEIRTNRGPFRADAYVLALGSYTPLVLDEAGLRLPVYPAKGYSVSLTVVDAARAPTVGLIDDERKHVYSRLGEDIRIAGMAEFTGFDTQINDQRARQLVSAATDLFPGALDVDKASFWTGLRPQTPDSVPIIGRARLENLYVNTGHGTLVWTMACGSGSALANLISGRAPGIDMTGLGVERFRAI